MKIEIELTEADAAAIWDNHHRSTIKEVIESMIAVEAYQYRRQFPHSAALERFRKAHANHADPEFHAVDTSKMFQPTPPPLA